MADGVLIVDDFVSDPDVILAHAEAAGFGSWKPSVSDSGYNNYDGMCFMGRHHEILAPLSAVMGQAIFPCTMFFRKTSGTNEEKKVHSDLNDGSYTAILYLTDHDGLSGTGFYKHKATGSEDSPPLWEIPEGIKNDMPDYGAWERTDFIPGKKNRLVVFPASKWHSRLQGEDVKGRVVWVCHFFTLKDFI